MKSRVSKRSKPDLRFWHRWLGLSVLIPTMLLALTGILLTYQKDLIKWSVGAPTSLPSSYSLKQVMEQTDIIAPMAIQMSARRVQVPNDDAPYWTIVDADNYQHLYNINTLAPYQHNTWVLDLLHFAHELHTTLLLSNIGKWLLLFTALTAIILTFTGFWLWWPGRAGFRWRFVKPKLQPKRASLQFHRHTGAALGLLMSIVILTAAIMMWQKQVAPLLSALPLIEGVNTKPVSDDALTPAVALALAQQQVPDGWPTFMSFPSADKVEYKFRFRLPDEIHPNGRTRVYVNKETHAVAMTIRADKLPPAHQWMNLVYPLHSGYGMPLLYSLIVLLSGWVLLYLGCTGTSSYIRRTRTR